MTASDTSQRIRRITALVEVGADRPHVVVISYRWDAPAPEHVCAVSTCEQCRDRVLRIVERRGFTAVGSSPIEWARDEQAYRGRQ